MRLLVVFLLPLVMIGKILPRGERDEPLDLNYSRQVCVQLDTQMGAVGQGNLRDDTVHPGVIRDHRVGSLCRSPGGYARRLWASTARGPMGVPLTMAPASPVS